MRRTVWAISILAIACCWSLVASGQEAKQKSRECRKLLKQAITEVEEENYTSGLDLLGRVFECDPGNPDAFYYQGVVLLHQGDSTGAVSALESGLQGAPRSWRLNLLLARMQVASGELESASALLNGLFQVKPDHAEALYLQGLIHLAEGDSTEALRVWNLALKSKLQNYPK